MTNALHHRADSVSSLVVLTALVTIVLGGPAWHMLDKGLGLMLGAWLGGEAIRMLLGACHELIDTAPDEAVIGDLREHVLQVEGAVAYHHFRARRLGDMLTIDLHLQVDPGQTVAQGHAIAEQVQALILEQHPEVAEVLVHVEPADERNLKAEGVHDLGQ
jgi:cation diffusion facilitator family transporter